MSIVGPAERREGRRAALIWLLAALALVVVGIIVNPTSESFDECVERTGSTRACIDDGPDSEQDR